MNILTFAFFVHSVIATLIVGITFFKRNNFVAKNFGIGLLLNSAAFAFWSLCILMPQNITTFMTPGAVLFLISLLFFVYAAIENKSSSSKIFLLGVSVVFVVLIFIFGRYIIPTNQYISPEGLLFFNLAPMVQMLYLFGLLIATIPMVERIGNMFKPTYISLIKFSLIIQIIGGVILITNNDYNTLFLTGLVIGVAQFVLWSILLFRDKIWA